METGDGRSRRAGVVAAEGNEQAGARGASGWGRGTQCVVDGSSTRELVVSRTGTRCRARVLPTMATSKLADPWEEELPTAPIEMPCCCIDGDLLVAARNT